MEETTTVEKIPIGTGDTAIENTEPETKVIVSNEEENVNKENTEQDHKQGRENEPEPSTENTNVESELTNIDDEFEQISDGTFEVDENSQASSAGGVAVEDSRSKGKSLDDESKEIYEETKEEDEKTKEEDEKTKEEDEEVKGGDEEVKGGDEEVKEGNIELKEGDEETKEEYEGTDHDGGNFESVDANLSANSMGATVNESDALGDSDMTLPNVQEPADDNARDEPSESGMDVDEETRGEDNEPDNGNNEDNEATTENQSADVEMDEVNDSFQAMETGEEDGTGAEAHNMPEADATSDSTEKEKDKVDGFGLNEKSKDVAEHEDEDEVYKESKSKEDVHAVQEDEGEKDHALEEETPPEFEEQPDKEQVEQGEVSAEKATENIEEDVEPDDQPVENVQEPEESDVCLIPDDTETQVTEAEKEQAILARENAEKEAEAAEAEAEKEKSTETEKDTATDSSINETNDQLPVVSDAGDAQAAEAESAAAADGSEETPPNAAEAPDPDEPLLEELHCSTTESGAPAKIIISWVVAAMKKCFQCKEEKHCGYRFKNPENVEAGCVEYLCEQSCCEALINANPGKFFIRRKKFLVEEVVSAEETTDQTKRSSNTSKQRCIQCKEEKNCKYFFRQDEDSFYICNDDCYNLLNAEEPDKFKLKRHSIRVRNIGATISNTSANTAPSSGKKSVTPPESRVVARTGAEAEAARLERVASFTRRCAECFNEVTINDKNLLWETMDFCNEICLGKYQRNIGSSCQTCHGEVPHQALGKYCVRFGFDIRQFCCATCLNEYKKGLKTCSCCQKDISSGAEGFLAPVGDKEQFKDFCSQACMRRYDSMCNPKKKPRSDTCAVCNNEKPVRVEILLDDKEHTFCSNPCFSAFKFVSNIVADQCGMCNKYFERKSAEAFTIYTDRRPKVFCSRICLNVFIIVNRRIVSCQWCKVKKYNFDMIYKQHEAQEILMCSLNCLTLYGVSINAFSRTVAKCDNCNASATPQYHLTMSDASMRNFCTYQCVMQFQSQFARAPLTLDAEPSTTQQPPAANNSAGNKNNSAPFPTGLPKRVKLKATQQQQQQQKKLELPAKPSLTITQKPSNTLPVISTVSSLASGETMIGNVTVRRSRVRPNRKVDSPPPLVQLSPLPPTNVTSNTRGRPRKNVDYGRSPSPAAATVPSTPILTGKRVSNASTQPTIQTQPAKVQTETKIIAVPPYPPAVRNVQTHCKPQTVTVGFQCEPEMGVKEVQTDKDYSNKVLIPVPVPIYIPQPIYMYSAPFPVPVPIPLPIPVPIFIPTTRNSANGIMKEIKKIQDKMPADPFEAELLMMAEMVAEEKHVSDSDSDDEIKPDPSIVTLQYQNNVQQQSEEVANNSYGEDVLQMALKMATGEYDHPQQHSTVDLETAMTANTITNPPPGMTVAHDNSLTHINAAHHLQQAHPILETQRGRGRKRGSMVSPVSPRNNRSPVKRQRLQELEPQTTPETVQPVEKPDANMCLKYTFGVNAWKQWVMTKNLDLEKSTMRKRPFKTELLQMTADELNYSLCLFVKEVRKPNGTEYAPDTIYYLVLGIQQYLYENGRIDNIFTDPYYERFTDCLDEVARKFSVLYNDSQYIVTRVEEEHLWECKQLGAHSPHVLLSTLMFFNTKHFNLTTVEEHMQLSFSHIMKHWKRSAQNAKTPGTRNVLLRFYPPQAGLDANPRKKKVYEQQENEDNPLRCPVRLYEFYLSKCPESVKTRNDVFYLQPERSCVPDSPVWYSTQALSQEALQKMLHRVKMVKEINIALLTS